VRALAPYLLLALGACGPGGDGAASPEALDWRARAGELAPGVVLLEGFDPMGDWRLAQESGDDWSLLAVSPEARGTWRLTLRRSAWSETHTQVHSELRNGILVLSQSLELTPGEHVGAFFAVLADGRELFVPDTRLSLLARRSPPRRNARAGFQRVPLDSFTPSSGRPDSPPHDG